MEHMTKQHIEAIQKRITGFHIVQSVLAGIYIFFVFWVMHSFQSRLAVASLGASAFIAFSFPHNASSHPRYLIGGYCMGALSGMLCSGLVVILQDVSPLPSYIPACALSVFLSMLLMTVFNLEHPPSSALAVAIAIAGNPVILSAAGLGCIIVLCILKQVLKKRLRNL